MRVMDLLYEKKYIRRYFHLFITSFHIHFTYCSFLSGTLCKISVFIRRPVHYRAAVLNSVNWIKGKP
ncbi:hypothetical protein BJV82DRAFT_590525 [Fennellomyces sp. T-0311]|nr:hypothetical protein BJV82DRAFT_590525 [Fennellomyces sp. T-0311]